MFFILEYLSDGLGCILIWGAVRNSHGILKKFNSFELLLQVINIPWNIREKDLYVYFILDALCDFSLFSVFTCIGIFAVHEYW